MAARFSQDPFFHGQQQDMIDTYSRSAWDEIFEKSFSEDDALDITVVQATNMLAVVDFTSRQLLSNTCDVADMLKPGSISSHGSKLALVCGLHRVYT